MLQFCCWWKTIFDHTALVIQDYRTSSNIASSPGYVVRIMADGSTDEIYHQTNYGMIFFHKKKQFIKYYVVQKLFYLGLYFSG